MRNHHNTILAMKASTLLMSISALVLVVASRPDVVIPDSAPALTSDLAQPVAPHN